MNLRSEAINTENLLIVAFRVSKLSVVADWNNNTKAVAWA